MNEEISKSIIGSQSSPTPHRPRKTANVGFYRSSSQTLAASCSPFYYNPFPYISPCRLIRSKCASGRMVRFLFPPSFSSEDFFRWMSAPRAPNAAIIPKCQAKLLLIFDVIVISLAVRSSAIVSSNGFLSRTAFLLFPRIE